MDTKLVITLNYGDYNMLAANLEKLGIKTSHYTEEMFAQNAHDISKIVIATYPMPSTYEGITESYYLVVENK